MTNPSNRKFLILSIIILIIFSVAIYLGVLSNGFVHDDIDQIINNEWIRSSANIPAILVSHVWGFESSYTPSNYYRPVMHLVYIADYALFGLNPRGYHLTSIIMNSATTVVVFLLSLQFLTKRGRRDSDKDAHAEETASSKDSTEGSNRAVWAALGAALIFAAHPIHSEAVAWAACVPELMLTLCYLLSIYLYISFKGSGNKILYLFSLIAFFISTLSKEPALTLPAMLILYDLLIDREPLAEPGRWIKRHLAFWLTSALYLILRLTALSGFAPSSGGGANYGLTGFENFLNTPVLLFDYAKTLVLPMDMNFFHTFIPVRSVSDSYFLLAALFLIASFAVMVSFYRTKKRAFFAVLLILLPLLPVLYVPLLGENVFAERYTYLPSAGAALLVALILHSILTSRLAERGAARILAAFVLTLLFLSSYQVVLRNRDFKDDHTIWADTVVKNPDNGYVHKILVDQYLESGEDEKAIEHYKMAINAPHVPADKAEGYYNIGNIYSRNGMLKDAKNAYRKSLEADPSYYMAWNNLGSTYAMEGRLNEAIASFKKAVEADRQRPEAKKNLERALRLKSIKDG